MSEGEGKIKLELHPNAAKNFNEQAVSLLSEIAPRPQLPDTSNRFVPDWFVSARFTEEDMKGGGKPGLVDNSGNQIARFFQDNNQLIGLFGDGYKRLVRIAEGIQKTKNFRHTVSISLLIDFIFDWLQETYKKTTTLPMTEYVITKCEPEIQEMEVWFPIAMTYVESEFGIGKVRIATLTREMFDSWRASQEAGDDELKAAVDKILDRMLKDLQGLAAAVTKVVAEPTRAKEIAVEESEKALAILRFFSPANFFPQKVSYCTLRGKEHFETLSWIIMRKNQGPIFEKQAIKSTASGVWILDNKIIAMSRESGLDTMNNLLLQENRTEFQDSLLDALFMYSRSSLAKEFADKLVYILVALEGLLLKNNTEPIQQNLSERLAIVTFEAADKRRAFINIVKEVYGLRSSFIHHGQNVSMDALKTMEEFMRSVWTFFARVISFNETFATKEDFIDAIDEAKLGGSSPFA